MSNNAFYGQQNMQTIEELKRTYLIATRC